MLDCFPGGLPGNVNDAWCEISSLSITCYVGSVQTFAHQFNRNPVLYTELLEETRCSGPFVQPCAALHVVK